MASDVISAGINTQAVQAAGTAALYNFAVTAMWFLILGSIGGLIIYFLYRKSFNVKVTILDNSKAKTVGIIQDGLRGKMYQTRPGEFRFKIFNARRHKIRYNQESITPEDFYMLRLKNNKVKMCLYMAYDSEGQLIPARFESIIHRKQVLDEKGNFVKDKNGNNVFVENASITALVKPVDVAWFYKEYDKESEIFDARSAFDKWGWLVLTICLILVLGAFLYTSYKFSDAAKSLADSSAILAKAAVYQNTSFLNAGGKL